MLLESLNIPLIDILATDNEEHNNINVQLINSS